VPPGGALDGGGGGDTDSGGGDDVVGGGDEVVGGGDEVGLVGPVVAGVVGPPPPLALTFGENGSVPPKATSSGGVGRGDWPPCELGAGAGDAGVVPCVVGAPNGEFWGLLGFRIRKYAAAATRTTITKMISARRSLVVSAIEVSLR